MRSPELSAAQIVDLWDRGVDVDHLGRARLALAAVHPNGAAAELDGIRLGQRDAWLLELRRRLLGDTLDAVVVCPACGERLGLSVDVAQIRFDDASPEIVGSTVVELDLGDLHIRCRTLADEDIAAAVGFDVEETRRRLIASCLLEAQRASARVGPDELSDAEVEAMGEALVEHDPQSDVRLGLACALCGHEWQPVLDISRYLWEELEIAVRHLVDDVHVLASAYGWTEREILALPASRRAAYVEHLARV